MKLSHAPSFFENIINRAQTQSPYLFKYNLMFKFHKKYHRSFNQFLTTELSISKIIYSPGKIDNYVLDFDLSGSEQIWTTATNPFNFISFARPNKHRIAYAVSAEWGRQTKKWYRLAQKEFQFFSAVSVRKKRGGRHMLQGWSQEC